jgi:hypothetical protein
VKIYKQMGVETHFEGNEMTLVKTHDFKFEDVDFELNNTPDIAYCHLSWSRYCTYHGLHVEN